MPKSGYRITGPFSVTLAGVTRNVYRIESRIILFFDNLSYTAAEITAYATYVENNIESIWNSLTPNTFTFPIGGGISPNNITSPTIQNYGLHQPFSSSNDILQTEITVTTIPLGTSLATFFNRNPLALQQGECLIFVQSGNARASILSRINNAVLDNGRNIHYNTGFFFINYDTGSVPIPYVPINAQFANFPAHEFGHILGLADRYHAIAYIHGESFTVDEIEDKEGLVRRSSNVNPPMYLPGFFDSTVGGADWGVFPYYIQAPYDGSIPPAWYNPNYQAITLPTPPGPPTQAPQSRMNRLPYISGNSETSYFDIDYSTKYGWIHNIMSNAISPNDPNRAQNPLIQNVNGETTYLNIYQNQLLSNVNYIATANPTIIITKRQIDIVTNQEISPNERVGIEIVSYSNIFRRYVFFKDYNTATDTVNTTPNDNVYDFRMKFFTEGGTFVGLLRDYDDITNLDTSHAAIVTDETFSPDKLALSIASGGLNLPTPHYGIDDVMDYRMCSYDKGTGFPLPLQWNKRITNANHDTFEYTGCFTPFANNNLYTEINVDSILPVDNRLQITVGGPNILSFIQDPSKIPGGEAFLTGNTPWDSAVGEGFAYSPNEIQQIWDNKFSTRGSNIGLFDGTHYANFCALDGSGIEVNTITSHPLRAQLVNLYTTANLIDQYTQLNPPIVSGTPRFPLENLDYRITIDNRVYKLSFNLYRNKLLIIDILLH